MSDAPLLDRKLLDFRAALSSEALRMEPTVVKAGLILASVGLALVMTHALVTYPHWDVILLTAGMFVWQSTAMLLLRANIGIRVLAVIDPVVEALFPTVLLISDVLLRTGRTAAYFSLTPIIYMYAVLLSVVRLRPLLPVVSGLIGATGYLVMFHFWILPDLKLTGAITLDEIVFLYLRSPFIALGGGVGTFVVLSLRKASGQAHSDLRAKELFGKYRIGEEIAAGGMGVVMRATYCPEGGFERDVAMKRIHPHLVKDAALVQSFRAEAELSARMLHPNIVQVLDFGRVDDTWFYAMEFVDGLTLHEAIKACRAGKTAFPIAVLAYVAREVCAGLDYAHRGALGVDGRPLHVVHRDLTPSNVLLSRTGQVKIADFGVARALLGASALQTQTLAGKMPYMAPEQASGGPLDGRTDLFTLGIVLWESTCNRMLFYRDNEAATLHAVLNQPVLAPSDVRPDVPREWDTVVLTALAREPRDRYASARALSDALAGFATSGPEELAAFLASLPSAMAEPQLATPHGRTIGSEVATQPHRVD